MLGDLEVAFAAPMMLRVHDHAALMQLEGEKTSSKAKYVGVRAKFILDYTRRDVLKPEYCKSERIAADVFTNVLPSLRLSELRVLVGLSEEPDESHRAMRMSVEVRSLILR
ncbi:hypothetical protein PR003_g9888 [Phytophthora rubi]|uniref:Uncharacterized protein n=1 Tax=Phytophthora rubi TaxID=129364 RepID=A0A6A3MV24_9STRA|nr:hypothetical protein PR001_g9503 [Phytophthora rubi]KAE9042850.1 hypothetical protein PR002_g3673 [Phytophthora rubi]KAE9341648.1 hypothetical protein PR003_g9888 [Phytophthora rubi]